MQDVHCTTKKAIIVQNYIHNKHGDWNAKWVETEEKEQEQVTTKAHMHISNRCKQKKNEKIN